MTDLLTRLTDARPTDAELDAMWSPADRAARLDDVRTRPAARRGAGPALGRGRRGAPPWPCPHGRSTPATRRAADLRALARSARALRRPGARRGHLAARGGHVGAAQRRRAAARSRSTPHQRESWTSFDGTVMVIDHADGRPGGVRRARRGRPGDVPVAHARPSPPRCPTTPTACCAYLAPRVFGSSSHAEAMYSALPAGRVPHPAAGDPGRRLRGAGHPRRRHDRRRRGRRPAGDRGELRRAADPQHRDLRVRPRRPASSCRPGA